MDFATFLMDLSHGDVNRELTDRLKKIVQAVEETGKVGTLSLKFNVKKEGTMAVVHCDATVKLPEPPMPGTMFFFGKDEGTLCREDPRQMSLKEVFNPPRVIGDLVE